MNKITPGGKNAILTTIVIGVLFVILSYMFGPAASQLRNMTKAKDHVLHVSPLIKQDKFRYVTIEPFTSGGGTLGVFGGVSSSEDLDELTAIIEASQPPVKVIYGVRVYPVELLTDWESGNAR